MTHPLIELGGSGPLLHWAPANGFPTSSYRPIIDRLTERYRVINLPPRALWPGAGPPPDRPGSWEDLADDFVAGLEQHGLDGVVAVGHSFGGVMSLVAAARHRRLFRGLALLDPTILGDEIFAQFRIAQANGWKSAAHPLARRTRERRARFASYAEAVAFFRTRKLFADWSDGVVEAFVEGMLQPDGDGCYRLALSPEWEAYYYESIYLGIWDDIGRLDPSLPILAAGGAESDTFLPETRARFQAQVPWAEMAVVDGGHLFPQSTPGQTAAVLTEWLAGLPNVGVEQRQ